MSDYLPSQKITPQNCCTRQALCILGPWCLEVILRFSVWSKLQFFSPTWSVLLVTPQVTGSGDKGNKKQEANSAPKGAGRLFRPVLCRKEDIGDGGEAREPDASIALAGEKSPWGSAGGGQQRWKLLSEAC